MVLVSAVPACRKPGPAIITGTVKIPAELQQKITPTAVLYVVARAAGTRSGPPLAVQRITPPFNFPLDFKLSQKNAMLPDKPFQGRVNVSARISQSGSASPINPGDIEGTASPSEVTIGEGKPVTIDLNRVRE